MNAPAFLSRLSARERLLVTVASALLALIALIYGVLMPGLDARVSAQSRNERAAADLAEAQRLVVVADAATPALTQGDVDALTASATSRGLMIIEAKLEDGAAILRIASTNSHDVIAWAAEASSAAIPLRSLAIARDETGELAVDAAFSRSVS